MDIVRDIVDSRHMAYVYIMNATLKIKTVSNV